MGRSLATQIVFYSIFAVMSIVIIIKWLVSLKDKIE